MNADITNKKTAVVMGATGNYAVGVAITIMSLEERSPQLADNYVIYYDGWDEKTLSFVKSLSPAKVRMIPYELKEFTAKHPELFKNTACMKMISRYTHLQFSYDKYLNLLKEFDQVIRMGSDLVIIDDITALKSIDSIGWRCAGLAMIKHKDTLIDRPNGDLYIFNKEIPIDKVIESFYKYILIDYWDEIAFAKTAYDLDIPTTEVPMEYNISPLLMLHRNLDNIKVFHTVGPKKIWNYTLYQYLFPEYTPYIERYNKSIGNLDYKLDSTNPYKNRYQFVRSTLCYNIIDINSINIYNKDIKFKFDTLKAEYLFFYKNYTNFYFKLKTLNLYKFRIYFIIEKDDILHFTKYINEHLLLKEKSILYKFHKYNDTKCTYTCDIKEADIESKLNELIDTFTLCIDMYDYYYTKMEKDL